MFCGAQGKGKEGAWCNNGSTMEQPWTNHGATMEQLWRKYVPQKQQKEVLAIG